MKPDEEGGQSLEVAIDQLIFARQREWSGTFVMWNRLRLRDLIVETVKPFTQPTESREREALRRLLQWAKTNPWPDHACVECRPNSSILKPGFLCAYHNAAAILGGEE